MAQLHVTATALHKLVARRKRHDMWTFWCRCGKKTPYRGSEEESRLDFQAHLSIDVGSTAPWSYYVWLDAPPPFDRRRVPLIVQQALRIFGDQFRLPLPSLQEDQASHA